MNKFAALILNFLISIQLCQGSVNYFPLNTPIKDGPNFISRVQVEASGWLSVIQEFNEPSLKCEDVADWMSVTISPSNLQHQVIPLTKSCEDKFHRLVFRTVRLLKPKVDYSLRVSIRHLKQVKPMNTFVGIEYEDPNYSSGPEQSPKGARILDKNGTLLGSLDSSRGMKTAWLKLPGNQGQVILSYELSGSPEISVVAYRLGESLKQPKFLKALKMGEATRFNLEAEMLLLKLEGSSFGTASKFSVSRKDVGSALPIKVAAAVPKVSGKTVFTLVDRFVFSPNSAMLILRFHEKLKPGIQLAVFGQLSGEEMKQIGVCKVAAIQNKQATCQLAGVDINRVKQLRVEEVGE